MYTSTINPGGWVPKKALRSVYRREYPRFLRTFTQYVSKKNQSLPLDLINQSIGKHISSFWTLYCHLVPKITRSFWTSWFDTCIYCHPIYIAQQCVCQRFQIWYITATIRSIIQKCLTVDHPASDLSTVRPHSGWRRSKYGLQSLSVQMCRSNKKKTGLNIKWNITTHQPHPYSYNCNFFLFPYNSITLLKVQ